MHSIKENVVSEHTPKTIQVKIADFESSINKEIASDLDGEFDIDKVPKERPQSHKSKKIYRILEKYGFVNIIAFALIIENSKPSNFQAIKDKEYYR